MRQAPFLGGARSSPQLTQELGRSNGSVALGRFRVCWVDLTELCSRNVLDGTRRLCFAARHPGSASRRTHEAARRKAGSGGPTTTPRWSAGRRPSSAVPFAKELITGDAPRDRLRTPVRAGARLRPGAGDRKPKIAPRGVSQTPRRLPALHCPPRRGRGKRETAGAPGARSTKHRAGGALAVRPLAV
jgi:hypothetical protein